jgi:hypothetical protein
MIANVVVQVPALVFVDRDEHGHELMVNILGIAIGRFD